MNKEINIFQEMEDSYEDDLRNFRLPKIEKANDVYRTPKRNDFVGGWEESSISNQNPSPLHQKLSKKHRGPSEVVYEFESSEIPELIKVVKPKDGTEENSD